MLLTDLALELLRILDVDQKPPVGGGGSVPSTLPISLEHKEGHTKYKLPLQYYIYYVITFGGLGKPPLPI